MLLGQSIAVVAMPGISWAALREEFEKEKNSSIPEAVDGLVEIFKKNQSSSVQKLLVLGSGTGEYVIELAKKGFRVLGVDDDFQNLEATVLKQVQAKTASRLFHVSDLELDTVGDLDIVVVLNKALSQEGFEREIGRYKRMLKANGMFVLELLPTNTFVSRTQMITLNNEPVEVRTEINSLQADGGLLEEIMTIVVRDGEEALATEQKRKIKIWSVEELQQMLADFAFSDVQIYTLGKRIFITSINI